MYLSKMSSKMSMLFNLLIFYFIFLICSVLYCMTIAVPVPEAGGVL
jgi:hypothetical protein